MKLYYGIKRTINCGNYESIALEYSEELDCDQELSAYNNAKEELELSIESVIEEKEAEIRKQLNS